MLPLTGLTATCGNLLVRKDAGTPPLGVPVRPRSPFAPPLSVKVTTVMGEPNVRPWSVDFAALMAAASKSYHQTWMEWSGLTVTNAPCMLETISVPPLGANVAPPSVDRKK